jgi:hypothetical protein
MRTLRKHSGYSLTEILLAIGTLGIGMLFIAGVFPVGLHFATIATEQTIAAVVADEAFAKIRLYAMGDPANPADDVNFVPLRPFRLEELGPYRNRLTVPISPYEFAYPSDPNMDILEKQYYWSALCRLTEPRDPASATDPNRAATDPNRAVQVTVFVCRKAGPNARYLDPAGTVVDQPVPFPVVLVDPDTVPGIGDELRVQDPLQKTFINDGYTILANETGQIYRVLERYTPPADDIVKLDRPWQGGAIPGSVWVIPPPAGGGRNPCIAVFQKVIRF